MPGSRPVRRIIHVLSHADPMDSGLETGRWTGPITEGLSGAASGLKGNSR